MLGAAAVGAAGSLAVLTHPLLTVAIGVAALAAVLIGHARDSALALACIGLVTISWDRVSLRTAGMTLKPAYVAFALALLVDCWHAGPGGRSGSRVILTRRAAIGSLALLAVATARGGYLIEGGRQLVVVALGALVPAWVCFRLGREPGRRRVLVGWSLAGAGFAAAFGIYQFAAGYLGLPTAFAYAGLAGSLGRTAGLSYEPAYFAMYLTSLLPLSVGLLIEPPAERTTPSAPRLVFCLLVLGVVVANTRAGYIALPLALLIPLAMRPGQRRTLARPVVLLGATLVVLLLLSAVVRFDVPRFLGARLASIADTQEVASNAPRLALYRTDRRIAGDHLLLGIGPGALGHVLPRYGYPVDQFPDLARVVANNVWLQAVLDCGLLGLVTVAVVLGVLLRLARRGADRHGRWLALGALLVLVIGGLLTSIFWDAKYWALIGLALSADEGSTRSFLVASSR